MVYGSGFRVPCWDWDSEFRVVGFGVRVSGFGLWVSGFGFRVPGFVRDLDEDRSGSEKTNWAFRLRFLEHPVPPVSSKLLPLRGDGLTGHTISGATNSTNFLKTTTVMSRSQAFNLTGITF